MKNFAPILMMISAIGFYLVNSNNIDIIPERTDVLSEVYKADRQSRVEILTEMQSIEFDNDQERLDWLAREIEIKKEDDWLPFSRVLADIFTKDPNARYKSLAELVEDIK